MDKVTQKKVVEALLFASADPLPSSLIRDRLPEEADLGAILKELQNDYTDRGVELTEVGGAWAMRTSQDVSEYLILEKEETRSLSRAALETLSIIAYHQPVTRAEIENIRGVAVSKGTLDILLEQDWIKPGRRRETPGRPVTWVTTNAFLDQFRLEALTDLPGLDELKSAGLLDRRPAIETIPGTGELFDEDETEDTERTILPDESVEDDARTNENMKEEA
ncbi:MAG: SMC-Scp complex subunit ScpB [Alphaproteobacteria bacterium]|mgnify:FL=1|nr:SMC-Scp complex subunit ScpB [Alphaproteobacteria bacterium]